MNAGFTVRVWHLLVGVGVLAVGGTAYYFYNKNKTSKGNAAPAQPQTEAQPKAA